MREQRSAPPAVRQDEVENRTPARPYQEPELKEYGNLRELTQVVSNVTPGDMLGGSFSE